MKKLLHTQSGIEKLALMVGLVASVILVMTQQPQPEVEAAACVASPANGVAFYRLEETSGTNADDLYGNNDLTYTNFTAATGTTSSGKVDNAMVFADDDYLDGSNKSWGFDNSATFSTWIKTTETAFSAVMAIGETDVDNEMLFAVSSSGKICLYSHVSSGNFRNRCSSTSINDGNWHHVAGVLNGSSDADDVLIYVNGSSEIGTTGSNGTPANLTDSGTRRLRIGARLNGNASEEFAGTLDEVLVFSRALTASEVSSIYNADTGGICNACGNSTIETGETCDDGDQSSGDGCNSLCLTESCTTEPSNLISWYRGNDNVLDFKGSNEGIPTDITFVSGNAGQAMDFNATSSEVNIDPGTTFSAATSLSVSAWVKIDGGAGTRRFIFNMVDDDDTTVGPFLEISDVNEIQLGVQDGPGGKYSNVQSNTTLAVSSEYRHIVGTWTQGTGIVDNIRIYLDGYDVTDEASFTSSSASSVDIDSVAEWSIGFNDRNFGSTWNFDGAIDELMIYDDVLTASEVLSIYNAGDQGVCTATCSSGTSGNSVGCLGVDNAAPSFSVVTDDSSTVGSPTDAGTAVTFTATATDGNSDNYYLIVCADGDTVYSNVSAAPTCSGTQICVSSSTASGAQASCNSANVAATPTTVQWESFVCDHSTDSKCSATETTNSPYYVTDNDPPELTAMSEDDGIMTNGAIFASGLSGQAFSFDGTDDYIEIANESNFDFTNAVTVAHWFKLDTVSGYPRFVSKFGASPSPYSGWETVVGTGTSDKFCVNITISGTYQAENPCGTTTLVADTWYHGAFTYDGSNVRTYLNGVLEKTHAASGTIDLNNELVDLGRWAGDASNYLDGMLDDVQVYNAVLSDDQIEAIYEAGSGGICEVTTGCTGLPADTVLWLDAEGDFNDNHGTSTFTASGDAAANSTGKVGTAMTFDGTDDYASRASATEFDMTGEFTYDFWIKSNSTETDSLFATYNGGTARGVVCGLNRAGYTNKVSCEVYAPYSSNWATIGTTSTINDGSWHHVALVRDSGNTLRIYADGTQEDSASLSGDASSGSSTFYIGTNTALGDDFTGELDEIRFFTRGLSATEVSAIHAADSNGICTNLCAINNSLVGWWSGDVDATDRKHFNDGTFNGDAAVTSSSGGKINEAFTFDGTGDYVAVSDSDELEGFDNLTVSAWVKTSSASDQEIVSHYNSASPFTGFLFGLGFDTAANGKPGLFVADASSNTIGQTQGANTAVNDGSWHHVVVTYDGQNWAFYTDGSPDGSGSFSSPITIGSPAHDLHIGASSNSPIDRYFNGQIDELQIFNRILSDQEISNMYTAQNSGVFTGTCYESCLEEPANLVSHWQGDFDAKDSKGSNNGDTFGTNEPGDTLHFRGSVTDVDLAAGRDTFVSMAICSDGSTFGTAAAPCSGTLICDAQHQRPGSVVCDAAASTIAVPTPHGTTNYEIFVWDQDDEQATYTSPSADSYAVTDVAPVINSFTLNGGAGAFSPTAGTTENYSFTVAVTDNNGDGDLDQASESGKFYDEGASQTSACDDNTGTNANAQTECYAASSCDEGSTIDGDASATYTCTFPIYFNANPTAQWEAYFSVADGTTTTTGDSDTVSSLLQTINSIFGIDVVDSGDNAGIDIIYGNLAPGASTGELDQVVYVANFGNTAIDTQLYGSDMCNNWGTPYSSCSGDTLQSTQQEWGESIVNIGSGTSLTDDNLNPHCINNGIAVRGINTDATNNDPVYFGISLPSSLATGNYTGQNTFVAASDTAGGCGS